MNKILLSAAMLVCTLAANARVWRINYDENAKADFKTITEACTAVKVADTDTLYCEAGYHAGAETNNTISRDGMTVMGPGWGFEANYGNTSTICEARFSDNIVIAASHVTLTGIVCDNVIKFISSPLDNITVERCYANRIYSNNIILSNFYLINCFITSNIYILASYGVHNMYIQGNIIKNSYNINASGTPDALIYIKGSSDKITNINIVNNTIVGENTGTSRSIINVQNALIQDNIILNTANNTFVMDFDQTGNIIRKNVFSLSPDYITSVISENYPANYYIAATEASTFTCQNNTKYRLEEYYQLSENSPAKNAAYDGGDCGAFGGTSPYIICGRPQGVPYIYDVEVPGHPTNNKLHVTFKVKGQNE